MFALAIGCGLSVMLIRRRDVNRMESPPRGEIGETVQIAGSEGGITIGRLLKSKPFVIFLGAAFIFHFANAAMLPLVGQEISAGKKENASLYMSACIILAQTVMIPVTAWCGRRAGSGRKWLLLIAYIILPVRGLLYTMSSNPYYLVSIQVLDGVAAGIFGVVAILVVNDLSEGSGRASFAQAILATAVGLGASFSNLAAGFLVQAAGFKMGFLSLSALALAAMALIWIGMPETIGLTEKRSKLTLQS